MKTPTDMRRRNGFRTAIQAHFNGYSLTRLHSELVRLNPKFRCVVDDRCGRPHLRVANLTRSETLREIWAVLDTRPVGCLRDLAVDLERLDQVFGKAAISGDVTR